MQKGIIVPIFKVKQLTIRKLPGLQSPKKPRLIRVKHMVQFPSGHRQNFFVLTLRTLSFFFFFFFEVWKQKVLIFMYQWK